MEVLSDLLVDLVNTTQPEHHLYGGDLRALTTVMADVVDRSTVRLLPVLKNAAAQSLSANISSVTSTSVRLCIDVKTFKKNTRSSPIRRECAHLAWLYCTVQKAFQYETV